VYLCPLVGQLADMTVFVFFLFFTWHVFINVVPVTYNGYLYFNISVFIIYAILLFYLCKLYCTVFFYSCVMSVVCCHSGLCDVLILTLFIFNCQLTDVGICETCMYVGMYVCCLSHPQNWQLLGAKFAMNTGYAGHFHSQCTTHC
jgi:hypothetical protein